jgi:hypothetical protein
VPEKTSAPENGSLVKAPIVVIEFEFSDAAPVPRELMAETLKSTLIPTGSVRMVAIVAVLTVSTYVVHVEPELDEYSIK